MLIAHLLAYVNEAVLQGGLKFNQTQLEAKALLLGEICSADHGSSVGDERRCLRDHQHFVAHLRQVLGDRCNCSGFPRTRTPRQKYARDIYPVVRARPRSVGLAQRDVCLHG